MPLTEKQQIFVGRTDLSSRIEKLILDRRHPPLLLYGLSKGLEEARSLLLRRELIEEVDGGDRVQIELFRR